MADPNSGCWLWTGSLNNKGYGQIGLGGRRGRIVSAHRVSYELHFKVTIPAGLCVLHSCDVPSCVNPAHLRLGTLSDNARDCVQRRRHRSGSPNGEAQHCALLTEQQVRDIRSRQKRQIDCATQYGVTKATISAIWTRRNWAHVN